MKLLVLFSLAYVLCSAEALKVLVLFPYPVKSLSILGTGAVRHLLNAGHEVTYVTVFPLKNPPTKNFRQIDISTNMDILKDNFIKTVKAAVPVAKTPLKKQLEEAMFEMNSFRREFCQLSLIMFINFVGLFL